MPDYSISPFRAFEQIIRAREIVWALLWRDIIGRYRGSFAGLFWSLLNPLFSLFLYTFVFGIIFHARWGLEVESTFDFALVLFTGLIVHALLCDCITVAPKLVLVNPAFVKQMVFPLEILPIVVVGSAIFHAVVSIGLLLLVWLISHGEARLEFFVIPFLLAPLCLVALGCTWFLSAISVYFRDLEQMVGFIAKALLFLSPIFYPATSVPASLRGLLQLNPLTFVIESTRAVLLRGDFPQASLYFCYVLASFFVAWTGYATFQKLRIGFADVM